MARALIYALEPGEAGGSIGAETGILANESGTGGWDITFKVEFFGADVTTSNKKDLSFITVRVLLGESQATVQDNIWTQLTALATVKGYTLLRASVRFYAISGGL